MRSSSVFSSRLFQSFRYPVNVPGHTPFCLSTHGSHVCATVKFVVTGYHQV